MASACAGSVIRPDRAGRDPGALADGGRERHLVAGRERHLRVGHRPAARAVHEVDAGLAQLAGEDDRLLEVPAALHPVGGGDASEDRPLDREGLAHRVRHGERQAHPVLEAAAVLVPPAVGERGEELVEEVAVRHVDLDGLEARLLGPPRGVAEGADDGAEVVGRQLARHGVALGEGQRARRRPVASRVGPRPRARRLARARRSRPCAPRARAGGRARRPARR